MRPQDNRVVHIREIAPHCEAEIALVAQRMRDTLVEVEGPEVGVALYTMDWLQDRVRWHLNPLMALATVYLAVDADQQVIGHTIVRREQDDQGRGFGLFSTTYVIPAARRLGVATQLLLTGEQWMREQELPSAATWTSATNSNLINLYRRHGYAQTAEHMLHHITVTRMIKLEKALDMRDER